MDRFTLVSGILFLLLSSKVVIAGPPITQQWISCVNESDPRESLNFFVPKSILVHKKADGTFGHTMATEVGFERPYLILQNGTRMGAAIKLDYDVLTGTALAVKASIKTPGSFSLISKCDTYPNEIIFKGQPLSKDLSKFTYDEIGTISYTYPKNPAKWRPESVCIYFKEEPRYKKFYKRYCTGDLDIRNYYFNQDR